MQLAMTVADACTRLGTLADLVPGKAHRIAVFDTVAFWWRTRCWTAAAVSAWQCDVTAHHAQRQLQMSLYAGRLLL